MTTTVRARVAPRRLLTLALATGCWTPASGQSAPPDPLPSWDEGPARQAVLGFARRVTTPDGPELAARDHSLAERQPFKAALQGDTAYVHQTGAAADASVNRSKGAASRARRRVPQ